jgi:hypothetical protein
MTTPRDPEALLAAYLVDGIEVLPDRVVDAVLDEVHRTRQRTAFGPWSFGSRRRSVLIAAALLIALTIAAAAAAGAWLRQPDVAPDLSLLPPADVQASPSPSRNAPSAAPTASAVTSAAGVWIATGWMRTPRYDYDAVRLLDGRVLVVGGAEDEHDTSAELYDPATGTWTPTGNMLKPHGGIPATLLKDGKVLVGDVDDPAAVDSVTGAEVYDPASGTWTATGKMVNRGGSTATLLRDGKVLVIGYEDTGELFDPGTGTWTATGRMTDPRHSHMAVLLRDGKVLVAGGHLPGDQPTDSAELYDPGTGRWAAIAGMQAPRGVIEGFLQPDGTVLVVGGSARGKPQSVESYDEATGAWTIAADVSRPGMLVNASTTQLSDGRVLVTDSTVDSVEADLYDPSVESWTAAASMLRPHGTAAVLLLDGTVLLAGGRDCGDGICIATASAELYVSRGVSPPALPALPSPSPRPIPTPTPRPTPYPPTAGPVPAGGRTWRVTVRNMSSDPVTLFEAEEGENGLAGLCGTVTPNVVPPDTTMKVTFLLPPKRVKSCWIFVNPVPGEGGSFFQTSDAPMPGEFVITGNGQTGWLGR